MLHVNDEVLVFKLQNDIKFIVLITLSLAWMIILHTLAWDDNPLAKLALNNLQGRQIPLENTKLHNHKTQEEGVRLKKKLSFIFNH